MIDQATITRLRAEYRAWLDGADQGALMTRVALHLPALLDAAEREAELYALMNRARGLLIDRGIDGALSKEERAHLLVMNAFVDARREAINAARAGKGEHAE